MGNHEISEKKLFTILTIDLFGMTGLILPAVIVRSGGNHGLPAFLAASALAILAAFYFLGVTKNGEISFPGILHSLPSWLRWGVCGVYCVRFFIHALFLTILFCTIIQEVLLPNQKKAFILLPFFILVFLASGQSLSVRGSLLEVLFPYIFIPLLLVLILALGEVDYGQIAGKLWENTVQSPGWKQIYDIFLFYQPMEFLLFLSSCRPKSKKGGRRTVPCACLFVILIHLLLYVAVVGMFGTVRTGETLWSSLYIMQSVKLPGHFVERLDILFLVFYIFSTFALFSGYLFYSESLPGIEEKNRKKKVYSLVFLTAVFIGVLWNQDVERFFAFFVQYKRWVDVPLAFLVPLLLRGVVFHTGIQWKKLFVMCVCFLSAAGLSGCQNKVDIEDRNYVTALGVEPGKVEKLTVTYETADLSRDSSEEGRQKGKRIAFFAASLKEAEEKEGKTDDRQLDYGHLKAIVFKETTLLDQTLWKEIVDELKERTDMAGTTLVFFSRENPEEYMKLADERGTSLGEYLERMAANHKTDGVAEYTLLDLLREEAEGKHALAVPVLSVKDEKIYVEKRSWEEEVNPIFEHVLRFHIRANSDTEEDQNLKIRVKDRILPYLQELFAQCESKAESMEVAKQSLDEILSVVNSACEAEGANCKVSVSLCRESFPVKEYGLLVVPSGTYDALRIDLGEGKGANWWCMMYPSLCMVDGVVEGVDRESQEKLEEMMQSKDGDALSGHLKKNQFHIKWRISEIIQEFFGEL